MACRAVSCVFLVVHRCMAHTTLSAWHDSLPCESWSVRKPRVTLHAGFNGSLPEHQYYTRRKVLHHCVSTSILEVVRTSTKSIFRQHEDLFARALTALWGVAALIDISCSAGRPHLASQHPATLHHEQSNTSTQLSSGHGI
jgi:hypothetical protein